MGSPKSFRGTVHLDYKSGGARRLAVHPLSSSFKYPVVKLDADVYLALHFSCIFLSRGSSPFLSMALYISFSVTVDIAQCFWNGPCMSCCSWSNFSSAKGAWGTKWSICTCFKMQCTAVISKVMQDYVPCTNKLHPPSCSRTHVHNQCRVPNPLSSTTHNNLIIELLLLPSPCWSLAIMQIPAYGWHSGYWKGM